MIIDLKGLTPAEIERFCIDAFSQRPGRGLRVASWLYRNGVENFNAMEDLNRILLAGLSERCRISALAVERIETSTDGTRKLLYRLEDGNTVEGVLIPGPNRLTLCVSTQVGCASGCGFCLTAAGGLVRNLTPAEIVNQVLAARRIAGPGPISNIVLMGTGEPLHNYEAVKNFVEIATDRSGMGYGGKKITVSTCGLAPMIERMAADRVDASLAVSLNATTDEVRDRLMPVNKTYPLRRLRDALRNYCDLSGKTVTIEYVLVRGLNDANADAARLAEMLAELPCMVNLLAFNPYPGSGFERPDDERIATFRDALIQRGLVVVVRRSRGRDISAACGQLRAAQ